MAGFWDVYPSELFAGSSSVGFLQGLLVILSLQVNAGFWEQDSQVPRNSQIRIFHSKANALALLFKEGIPKEQFLGSQFLGRLEIILGKELGMGWNRQMRGLTTAKRAASRQKTPVGTDKGKSRCLFKYMYYSVSCVGCIIHFSRGNLVQCCTPIQSPVVFTGRMLEQSTGAQQSRLPEMGKRLFVKARTKKLSSRVRTQNQVPNIRSPIKNCVKCDPKEKVSSDGKLIIKACESG